MRTKHYFAKSKDIYYIIRLVLVLKRGLQKLQIAKTKEYNSLEGQQGSFDRLRLALGPVIIRQQTLVHDIDASLSQNV